MINGFRVVDNFDEVIRALALCKADNFTFLLWQNLNGKRIQFSCRLMSFSQTSIIKIELEVPKDSSFEKNDEFFIYQDDLNFLFKGAFSLNRKNTLTLVLEDKLYLKENRAIQRFTFQNMSFDIVIDYIDTSSKKKKSFKAELVDISEGGMSFSVPASNSTKLYEGMTISFRSLESINFEKPILGSIKYNKATYIKFGQTDVRYGVEFKEKARAIAAAIELFYKKKKMQRSLKSS